MNEFLAPIRERKRYYQEHPEEIEKVLKDGTKVAKKRAEETMKDVKKAMQIDYFKK